VDETYGPAVAGAWTYLYRAVDSTRQTIDFMLSPKRDEVAAKHFLQMARCSAAIAIERLYRVRREAPSHGMRALTTDSVT
jgi:transposase-like protein